MRNWAVNEYKVGSIGNSLQNINAMSDALRSYFAVLGSQCFGAFLGLWLIAVSFVTTEEARRRYPCLNGLRTDGTPYGMWV
jgi:hypothetical protein